MRWMVAIMSGSHRRGRFRAVGSINAISIMGGDEIDLREAEIEGGELTINLFRVHGRRHHLHPRTRSSWTWAASR